jgi:hypothetical protein
MPHQLPSDLRLFYVQRPAPHIPDFSGLQPYFPSLEVLFPSIQEQHSGSPTLAASELLMDLSGDGSCARIEHMLNKTQRTTPVWVRRMHLVDPLDVMDGTCITPRDGALPTFRKPWQTSLRKINDPYNEAYTDAVFACMASRLVETDRSPHFCRFFGTFNGRVPEYSYLITEDMPDVEGEDWFREGLKSGAFKVIVSDAYDPDVTAELTQPWEDVRAKLLRDEGSVTDDEEGSDEDTVDSASGSASDSTCSTEELSDLEEMELEVSGEATVVRPRLRLQRVSGGSGSGDSGSGSTESSSDELEYRIVVRDFPVQLTVLERCDGTMDDLMEDEVDEDASADMRETKEARWTAWVFQVIAALTTAQQLYDFVHNDLHTNNVMWCGTGETHLYYHVTGGAGGDRYYRVPTYGRIFKIIDFGRATFRPPAATKRDNHVWFPDAYSPDGQAAGQYNCGPYFDQKKPKITPNKSFDLCRLAVAMLDTLWPNEPDAIQPRKVMTREPGRNQAETVSPLWNLLWLWLTDRHGKNILRTPDDHERYKTFDLYCAIAQDAVNAVPAQQLTLPLFDGSFRCKARDIPADATVYKLQAIHRPATS